MLRPGGFVASFLVVPSLLQVLTSGAAQSPVGGDLPRTALGHEFADVLAASIGDGRLVLAPCEASSVSRAGAATVGPFARQTVEDGEDPRSPVDTCHVTRYAGVVIRSFADKRTEQLWVNGTERRLPADIARRAVRKLSAVDAASSVDDLRVPPGNRLHSLAGDRAGQHSVSINDQWRVCFRFENGDAHDVEVCDYH